MSFMKKIKSALVEDTREEESSYSEVNLEELRRQYNFNSDATEEKEEVVNTSEAVYQDLNFDMESVLEPKKIFEERKLSLDEDKTASNIYRVEKIRDALPQGMSNSNKKETTIGMIAATGLSLDELLNDASKRVEVLNMSLTASNAACESEVADNQLRIGELKAEIEKLEANIESKKQLSENNTTIITKEINRLNELQKFITV